MYTDQSIFVVFFLLFSYNKDLLQINTGKVPIVYNVLPLISF